MDKTIHVIRTIQFVCFWLFPLFFSSYFLLFHILRVEKFVFEDAPAQINTAPAQINAAPALLITAPAQPPATTVVVYTALFAFEGHTYFVD